MLTFNRIVTIIVTVAVMMVEDTAKYFEIICNFYGYINS